MLLNCLMAREGRGVIWRLEKWNLCSTTIYCMTTHVIARDARRLNKPSTTPQFHNTTLPVNTTNCLFYHSIYAQVKQRRNNVLISEIAPLNMFFSAWNTRHKHPFTPCYVGVVAEISDRSRWTVSRGSVDYKRETTLIIYIKASGCCTFHSDFIFVAKHSPLVFWRCNLQAIKHVVLLKHLSCYHENDPILLIVLFFLFH